MMKKINKSWGLKGGPNHVEISIEGYRADSPDRFNAMNVIPSGRISMQDVHHPVLGIDDTGHQIMMRPGNEYQFPGSMVTEFPGFQSGGTVNPQYQATLDWFNANPMYESERNKKPLSLKQLEPTKVTGYPRMVGENIAIPNAGKFKPDQYTPVQTPEGYQGLPIYMVNGKPVVVDKDFNAQYFNMYSKKPLFGKEELFPIYGTGDPYKKCGGQHYQDGGQPFDFTKMFKDVAKTQMKDFGKKSDAPQNTTTDGIIESKRQGFTNKMAENTFKALAMQEAAEMGNMMNQMMIPMAQYGENVQGYNADYSNAGAYFDAWNKSRQKTRNDVNLFLDTSIDMANSFALPSGNMRLAKQRTTITNPGLKSMYNQQQQSTRQAMKKSTNPWAAFEEQLNNGQQPMTMQELMGYMPGFRNGGQLPMAQDGITMYPYSGTNPALLPEGQPYFITNPAYRGIAQGAFDRQFPQRDPRKSYWDQRGSGVRSSDVAGMSRQRILGFDSYGKPIIGTHTSDPEGGIGQSMRSQRSGFRDTYDDAGWQDWENTQRMFNTKAPKDPSKWERPIGDIPGHPSVVTGEGELRVKTTRNPPSKTTRTGASGTSEEDLKVFTHEDLNKDQQDGAEPAKEQTRRGNVDDGSSSTTRSETTVRDQNGNIIFVTQPGYHGNPYGLLPTNMFRGRGFHTGPAIAYNPAETYLKSYDYKSRLFGRGPRRVTMEFDHYGNPMGPAPTQQNIDMVKNYFGSRGSDQPAQQQGSVPAGIPAPDYAAFMAANPMPEVYAKPTPEYIDMSKPDKWTKRQQKEFRRNPVEEGFQPAQQPYKLDSRERYEIAMQRKDFTGKRYEDLSNADKDIVDAEYWNTPEFINRAYGGPSSNQPMYPGADSMHLYTMFFQDGGEMFLPTRGVSEFQTGQNNQLIEEPWGSTKQVWKQNRLSGDDWVDWGIAGMNLASGLAEGVEAARNKKLMEERMIGDAVFQPQGFGDSSRGTWTANAGYFRPDQQTPVQFTGYNQGMIGSPMTQGRYGGQFQTGGEYYLSDDEINQIMAMGGQVEFLD